MQKQIGENLPLSSRQFARIEVAELQRAEDEFYRSRGVAVGARVDDRQLHPCQPLPHHWARVPGSVVEEDGGGLLPARCLLVELPAQSSEEGSHHVGVRVRLGQREPHLSARVEGSQQRDPGLDVLVREGGRAVSRHPDLPDEASLVQPRLVHVDDAAARLEERQHLEGVLLPQHQAALAVGLDGDRLRHPIAHPQLLPENVANEDGRQLLPRLFLHRLLDLLNSDDGLVRLKHLGDSLLYCISLLLVGLNSLPELLQSFWFLDRLSDEPAD